MIKKHCFFTILFLCTITILYSQPTEILDSINLEDITVYNNILKQEFPLFTKRNNIEPFGGFLTNRVTVSRGSQIPFTTLPEDEIFLEIYNDRIDYVYYMVNYETIMYSDTVDDDSFDLVFVYRINPYEELFFYIQLENEKIRIDDTTRVEKLKKYFPLSFVEYQKNKENYSNLFEIDVIHNDLKAVLYFEFKDNYLSRVYIDKS